MSEKRSTIWVGYKVHFSETCDDDGPQLITHVETTLAGVNDEKALPAIHAGLAEKNLLPDQHLVLNSLNPVTKEPARVTMSFGRSSPDPGPGPSVELHGGHAPGQVDFTRVGKALTSKGIAAEEPPPALLQIEPAGTFRDEHVVQTWVVCHPGTCLQAVMTTEVVRNHEDVAGGIVGFDQFEQLDVVRRIA